MQRKTVERLIDGWLDDCDRVALSWIEGQVRHILSINPKAKGFTMCMGGYAFYDKDGELMDDVKGSKALDEFMGEYDRILKLTGNPMKIIGPSGLILTDW